MEVWIYSMHLSGFHDLLMEESIDVTPIEMCGWFGNFLSTNFSKYSVANVSNALQLINNETQAWQSKSTFDLKFVPDRCNGRICNIMLRDRDSKSSSNMENRIIFEELDIQLYSIPHLERFSSALLESYPSMFFIFHLLYPNGLTFAGKHLLYNGTDGWYESYTMQRVMSSEMRSLTPTAFKLIKNAHLSMEEYIHLIKSYNTVPSEYDIACDWLKSHQERSFQWITETKTKLIIGIFLPVDFQMYSESNVFEIVRLIRNSLEQTNLRENYQFLFLNGVPHQTPGDPKEYFIEPDEKSRLVGIVRYGCTDHIPDVLNGTIFDTMVINYGEMEFQKNPDCKYDVFPSCIKVF